jgi:hypothetical protein
MKEKGKQDMSVDQWNATDERMMKSGSESSRENEIGMTYKQVLQSPLSTGLLFFYHQPSTKSSTLA